MILIGIAVGTGLFLYKSGARKEADHASLETPRKCKAAVEGNPACAKDTKFFSKVIEAADKIAFNAAWNPGTRRTPPSFDDLMYVDLFFTKLITQAQVGGKREADAALRQMQIDIEAAIKAGKPW